MRAFPPRTPPPQQSVSRSCPAPKQDLGALHPMTLFVSVEMASLALDMGMNVEARDLLEAAVPGLVEAFGESRPEVGERNE